MAIESRAVARIALKHHAVARLPLKQPKRPRADRVLVHVIAIGLDHLARHRREVLLRQHVQEVEVRFGQLDA